MSIKNANSSGDEMNDKSPSLSFDLIPLLLIVSYVSFQKKCVHTQVCTHVHE